jgi:hypothetical protein
MQHLQNGVAEVQWRILGNSARSALWESGLPHSFDIYVVEWACDSRNMSPTMANKGKVSPDEVYSGSLRGLSLRRVFGCAS